MPTAFRALVMLAVLVGLPAAWVYYGPLPEGAQRVADRFVAAAKEAVGRNGPSPYYLADSKDVSYMPPAPPFTGSTPAPTAAPAAKASPFVMQLEPLLAKLRQLGAAEYVLERWGEGGELYRFRCEMPLAASNELTQQFEAVAADPRSTVEQVVAEVATWRGARGDGVLTR